MSSRLSSLEVFLTISVTAVSETLLNVPSTLFPFFSFTDSLLPVDTEVSRDQSLVVAWAIDVTGESSSEVSRMTRVANCRV
jgi:hypothetical protein